MSRRYKKNSPGLFSTVLILVLALALVYPMLTGADHVFDPAPSVDQNDPPPGTDETPDTGTDTPDTPGTGTDTPDTPGTGGDDENVIPANGFAFAVGREDADGNCLHNRYVYASDDDGDSLTRCFYTVTCYRCHEVVTGDYGKHHFVGGTCSLCGKVCEHTDGDSDGYCDLACGAGCTHLLANGNTAYTLGVIGDNGMYDYEVYFYNVYPGGSVPNKSSLKANAAYVCTLCDHHCYHANVTETYTYKSATSCYFEEKCADCGYVFGSCMTEHKLDASGNCIYCGIPCEHTYTNGTCTKCGQACPHDTVTTSYTTTAAQHTLKTTCTECGNVTIGTASAHSFSGATCNVCKHVCTHPSYTGTSCTYCSQVCAHSKTRNVYTSRMDASHNVSIVCATCSHVMGSASVQACTLSNGNCTKCDYGCAHTNTTFSNGVTTCDACGSELCRLYLYTSVGSNVTPFAVYFAEGQAFVDLFHVEPKYVLPNGMSLSSSNGYIAYVDPITGAVYAYVCHDGVRVDADAALVAGGSYWPGNEKQYTPLYILDSSGYVIGCYGYETGQTWAELAAVDDGGLWGDVFVIADDGTVYMSSNGKTIVLDGVAVTGADLVDGTLNYTYQ